MSLDVATHCVSSFLSDHEDLGRLLCAACEKGDRQNVLHLVVKGEWL